MMWLKDAAQVKATAIMIVKSVLLRPRSQPSQVPAELPPLVLLRGSMVRLLRCKGSFTTYEICNIVSEMLRDKRVSLFVNLVVLVANLRLNFSGSVYYWLSYGYDTLDDSEPLVPSSSSTCECFICNLLNFIITRLLSSSRDYT